MPLSKTVTLESLFQKLLHYRDQNNSFSALGPWLKHRISQCSLPQLHQLPFRSNTYTRNRIAQELPNQTDQFEALVMRWDQYAETSIHGHPAFAFYYVISGAFKMEFFSHTPEKGLQLTNTRHYHATDTICFVGKKKQYDNTIHRVTCLEPGLTFHIYSEDAQKGECYESNLECCLQQSHQNSIQKRRPTATAIASPQT